MIAAVTLLMSSLDMLVQHGSQPKPLVAVFALINLFGLAQVIVVEVNPQAGMGIEKSRVDFYLHVTVFVSNLYSV